MMRRIICFFRGHRPIPVYWYWINPDTEYRMSVCTECGDSIVDLIDHTERTLS